MTEAQCDTGTRVERVTLLSLRSDYLPVCLLVSHHPPPHTHTPGTNNPFQGQQERKSPSLASRIPIRLPSPRLPLSEQPPSLRKTANCTPVRCQEPTLEPDLLWGKEEKIWPNVGNRRLKFALQDAELGEITPPLAGSPQSAHPAAEPEWQPPLGPQPLHTSLPPEGGWVLWRHVSCRR